MNEWGPTVKALVLKVAVPPDRLGDASVDAPSEKVTAPVAVGGDTVALRVTVWPQMEGFGVAEQLVVEEPAWVIGNVEEDDGSEKRLMEVDLAVPELASTVYGTVAGSTSGNAEKLTAPTVTQLAGPFSSAQQPAGELFSVVELLPPPAE